MDILNIDFEKVAEGCIKYTFDNLKVILHPRSRLSHKGDNGHVVVIGGDYGFIGAAIMAAEAALRVGAGLVSIATRREHASYITSYRPEVMCHAVEEASTLQALLEKATTIIQGQVLDKVHGLR